MSQRPGRQIARAQAHQHKTRAEAESSKRSRVWLLGGIAALIGIAVIVAFAVGGGDDGEVETGFVEASGTALPPIPASGPDPAIGLPAPVFRASTYASTTPVTVEATGNPALIMVFAHWCSHCQAELPVVVDYEAAGGFEGVDVFSVSTSVDPSRGNYPPDEWFAREGWTGPVLVDDADQQLALTLGVSSFPTWILLNGDGTVAARTTGELSPEQIDGFLAQAS